MPAHATSRPCLVWIRAANRLVPHTHQQREDAKALPVCLRPVLYEFLRADVSNTIQQTSRPGFGKDLGQPSAHGSALLTVLHCWKDCRATALQTPVGPPDLLAEHTGITDPSGLPIGV